MTTETSKCACENAPCRLPRLVPVQQTFPRRGLADLAGEIRSELLARGIGKDLKPGARVAIGVGSRGIASLPEVVREVASYFHAIGVKPFVVPAMGSHGGGTDEGQRKVLNHLGITEATAGCPIVSSVETVDLEATPDGIETYIDRTGFESDGIFLINRIKWHTTFEGEIESGLLKMASIGLGKVRGATNYHRMGIRKGLGEVVRSVGRHVLASGKVIGGLALVEDAHHEISRVAAERAEGIEALEIELLRLARLWMARIPFDEVDILIVDEIGKTISGTGMDSKLVNRHPYGGSPLWPWAPRILRIYLRDLSPQSYGNAVGIGLADVVSKRLSSKIDWDATLVNAQASSNLNTIRLPFQVANDREALELLSTVVGRECPASVTMVWIRNTLVLGEMAISENLIGKEIEDAEVTKAGYPFDITFDEAGNLEESHALRS